MNIIGSQASNLASLNYSVQSHMGEWIIGEGDEQTTITEEGWDIIKEENIQDIIRNGAVCNYLGHAGIAYDEEPNALLYFDKNNLFALYLTFRAS